MQTNKLSRRFFIGTNKMFHLKLNLSVVILALALLPILVVHATAQTPGSLDLSFGNGGKVTTDFNLSSEEAHAIAVQSDGKIVAAGRFSNIQTNTSDFALARYNTNGTLDASFGTGGKVTTDIGFRQETAHEVLIQADGKIVAVGTSGEDTQQNAYGFALARYNTDGSLDTSFGTSGKVRTRFNLYAFGLAAALKADGKILVAGESGTFGNSYFALARYNTDGTPDTSFGTGGLVTTDVVSNSGEQAYAVAIQADAKIVVAGFANNGSPDEDFALVRYNANGTLDTSFGTGGIVLTNFTRFERAQAVAIQSDGKIIAGGFSYAGDTADFALARYNTNGSLDSSFGTGGKVVNTTAEYDEANAVVIQANGKIIAAGRIISEFPASDFVLRRYNTDGSLDNTFGSGGTVTTDINNNGDAANAVTIQSDGKILAAGASGNPQNFGDFALVRYFGDSVTARRTQYDFDGDGKADISLFRPSNGGWYGINSSTNQFFGTTFGSFGDLITPADYDGDSKTDIAVFRPSNGVWFRINSSTNQFTATQFGISGDTPVQGDFDGDNRADISVFRPSNGIWYRINSSNNQFVAFQFGANGDKPQIGDFDGDNKTDIAVFRPSNGGWYIIRSSDNQFFGTAFGQSGDIPTAADYDGDGKTDIAVYRPSNGVWFRINSSNNHFIAQQWGIAEDRPAAADFDGDNRADLAVFRPSQGSWYILRSRDGFFAQHFGTAGDIPTSSAFGQ